MSLVTPRLPSVFERTAIEALRRRDRFDPEQIRQFYKSLCKNCRDDDWLTEHFPWSRELSLHALNLYQRFDSNQDGATKLVFQTENGLLIESVILRIDTGRTALCVSSQVGCAAACDFCATGKMGVAVSLSAAEILDQVVTANQLLAHEGRKVRNIVFMGMGEPFHNETSLYETLDRLLAVDCFYHSANRILVSTVGVTDAMLRCVERFPEVGVALSLHSVDQATREQIIPLAAKYPLSELRRVLVQLNAVQRNTVMIEYLMLAGVNDSPSDAVALSEWLQGLRVHVNLIPFNPIEGSDLRGSDRDTIRAFSETLKQAGLKTTTRHSLGNDIGAACGQLIQQENRQRLSRQAISRHRKLG